MTEFNSLIYFLILPEIIGASQKWLIGWFGLALIVVVGDSGNFWW